MRDLHSNISVIKTLAPIIGNNDTEGTPAVSADRQGFNSIEHIAVIGASGDTLSGSVKIALVLEDSDDDVTFAAVTDAAAVLGATPDASGIVKVIDDPAEDDTVFRCGYVGSKRYSRLRADFTGTHTNGTPIAMLALRGHPESRPVAE